MFPRFSTSCLSSISFFETKKTFDPCNDTSLAPYNIQKYSYRPVAIRNYAGLHKLHIFVDQYKRHFLCSVLPDYHYTILRRMYSYRHKDRTP